MKTLLYLVGAPATGKSTLMAELTAGCHRLPQPGPVRHDLLAARRGVVGAELGGIRFLFPGTDALPLNVSPAACQWVGSGEAPALLLAEGDRLAHRKFLTAAADGGYRVALVHLQAPAELLGERCAERGSTQAEGWRRGRTTKCANLAEWASLHYDVTTLRSDLDPPPVLAAKLRAAVPELDVLPEVPN